MKLSPVVVLALFTGISSVTIAQPEQLRSKVDAFYSSGAFDSALVYARDLVARQPDDPSCWYRMAFLFSLNGQADSSISWLDASVTHGFVDYIHFELDSDLDAIRSDPRYEAIIKRAQKEAFRAARDKALTVHEGEWTPLALPEHDGPPNVKVEISFDRTSLLVRATVHDTHFKDGDRSWRYGDGFMINFAVPENDNSCYSSRFHAFGISREQGRPVSVLVNRDGTYFLRRFDDMTPRIEIDTMNMIAHYFIRIPWTALSPFNPLLDPHAGINIRYTSQGDDGSRTRLTYLDNAHFDSERTPLRRFAPVTFVYRESSPLSVVGRAATRLTANDSASVSFAVWSPNRQRLSIQLSVRDQSGKEVWAGSAGGMLQSGRTVLRNAFSLPAHPGSYKLIAVKGDSTLWEEELYRYDARALDRIRTLLGRPIMEGKSPENTSSAEALRYRVDVLSERIRMFNERSDLQEVRRDMEDVLLLATKFESEGTVYGRNGYLLSAFRSPIDSSLQPFSIVFPEGYDRSSRYRLYVALHGSGVDEVGFVRGAAQNIKDPNAIVLAPRGRDLSGWWRGKDEDDAAYLIAKIKTLLPIEKTLCLGFSMGGYGTWRMSMLHPELFDAAAIMSGTPVPGGRVDKDDDMRNYVGRGKNLRYIVFHGTEDRSLPIDSTDGFVGMLKDAGYDITYIRVQGAGHGNMDIGEELGRWMREKFLGNVD